MSEKKTDKVTGVETTGTPEAMASTVKRGPPSHVDAHTHTRLVR